MIKQRRRDFCDAAVDFRRGLRLRGLSVVSPEWREMLSEPTTVEKLRGLPWSVATNAANQVFSQFTFFGSVFILFLDTLGLSKSAIGLILAFVPLSGLLAPIVAPYTARYGYKRVFVLFYALRKVVSAGLLLTPLVYLAWGVDAVFVYMVGLVATFSIVRAIEETAYFPWVQEFVPNSVRGKYSATSNIATAFTGFVAVWVGGYVLDMYTNLTGFLILFAVGVIAGFVSVWASTKIPGGASPAHAQRRNLRDALGDRDFRRYLLGVAAITLGTVPLASFLPLYMGEEVGLSEAHVVQLQMGALLGALLSSYPWGWAADRFGSKPVMQVGGWLLVLTPMLWWSVPRDQPYSLWIALSIAFVQGMANLGWGIGAGRLLYVSVVPVAMKRDYMAVYFAWVGLVAAGSQLVGGLAVDAASGLTGEWMGIQLNPYFPLFVAALFLPLVAIGLFRRVHGDSPVSTVQFAGFFLRGNPILAMGSMLRFYWAKDEDDTVAVTAKMGEIGSRLTVDELLDALADPRFNVRFESILAIARMPADARLTAALVDVLQGKSPALSVIAAWALARVGDRAAIEPLRAGLDAKYRSVQGYSARALGTLGDQAVIPELLDRLGYEEDDGLVLAYGTALGRLAVVDALPVLLMKVAAAEDDAMRGELALAIARILGDERHYIQLARGMRGQPGTRGAQAVEAARRVLVRLHRQTEPFTASLIAVEEDFARDKIDAGADGLAQWLELAPQGWFRGEAQTVIKEIVPLLRQWHGERREYLLLGIHVLTAGADQGPLRD